MPAAPYPSDPAAPGGEDYTTALRRDLRQLWANVIQRRAPSVLQAAQGPEAVEGSFAARFGKGLAITPCRPSVSFQL